MWNSRKEYRNHCREENVDFLQRMGRSVKVEYIRGEAPVETDEETGEVFEVGRGAPLACMVAFLDDNDIFTYGFSFKHPTLERTFDKPIGLHKAIQRACGHKKFVSAPSRYEKHIERFLTEAERRLRQVREEELVNA